MKRTNKNISPQFYQSKTMRGDDSQKFFIKTFGCQMNVADSDSMSDTLISNGYLPTKNPENADIILVNTCTVRQHAEEKALSFIGELKKFKIKNNKFPQKSGSLPAKTIIVAGCVASRLKENLRKKYPYVDKIIPATETDKFDKILKDVAPKLKNSRTQEPALPSGRLKNIPSGTHFVTITKGCSNFCSYCVVPSVRGKEISRPKKDILNDVNKLISNGINEITLLGQNVNSYKSGKYDFADLLAELNDMPEITKINFMTSHPKDMSDKIINAIAASNKVSRQIHLPVQSGSNKILKLMNRKYTREKYLKLIDKLKKTIPDVTFTTDVIVGFPAETEKDFQDTLNLVGTVGYASAYTFKYSPRENTKAFLLTDDIPLEIKKKRLAELNTYFKNT